MVLEESVNVQDFTQYVAQFEPDAAYVVSLGFPYMVSVFLCFPYMVSIFPRIPYMVMLPKHLNVMDIVLDRAFLCPAKTLHCPKRRHCDVTMMIPLLPHGIRADLSGSHGAAIVDRQSINYFLDFKVICCIFRWNNSIYIIGRHGRLGRLLGVFNKCSGHRTSNRIIGSAGVAMGARANNYLWNRLVLSKRHCCYFKLCLFFTG